ncbi:MAG: Dabb family protein [Muribaculaceae bacterium]|nr:Dabb family protein [Muribaculaceae bacterium]
MIRHVVTFRLRGSEAERRAAAMKFKEAIEALPEVIDVLKKVEVGININPAETYDMALIAEAETLADVAAYSAHPAHVAAVGIIKPMIESRTCVDFVMR